MTAKNWFNLILLSLFWGSSFFFYEKLLVYLHPIQVVILRLCFGAFFLLGYCLITKIKLPTNIKDIGAIFVMAFLINTLPFVLFAYAQKEITGSVAAILNSNTAFFGLLLAVIFIKEERLTLNKFFGVIMGLCGVIIAIGVEHIFEINPENKGQWLVILATLCYAFAGVWSRLKMNHLSGIAISCTLLLCSSSQILLIGLFTNSLTNIEFNLSIFGYALGIGVICTALAYLLYLKLIKEAGASNTALVTLLIPIVAICLNAFLLDESLQTNEIIGFVIILFGMIVLNGKLMNIQKKS